MGKGSRATASPSRLRLGARALVALEPQAYDTCRPHSGPHRGRFGAMLRLHALPVGVLPSGRTGGPAHADRTRPAHAPGRRPGVSASRPGSASPLPCRQPPRPCPPPASPSGACGRAALSRCSRPVSHLLLVSHPLTPQAVRPVSGSGGRPVPKRDPSGPRGHPAPSPHGRHPARAPSGDTASVSPGLGLSPDAQKLLFSALGLPSLSVPCPVMRGFHLSDCPR